MPGHAAGAAVEAVPAAPRNVDREFRSWYTYQKGGGRVKRFLFSAFIVIAITVQALLSGCAAEEGGGQGAMLVFSSFDGGGYDYYVTIDDPAVLAYSSVKDYGDSYDEMATGSGFDVRITFYGLKEGSTRVSVLATSPIIDSHTMVYEATVDTELNVTLDLCDETPIISFSLCRNGYIECPEYELILLDDGYALFADGTEYAATEDDVNALYGVFAAYDVASWDGFDGENPGVLDGEGFTLEVLLSDGTYVYAHGSNAFPENYHAVMDEWTGILEGVTGRALSLTDVFGAALSGALEDAAE